MNSFHSNTKKEERKQEVMSKMAYLKVQNECECILCVECREYRKNGSMSILGVQFVGHTSRLLRNRVCDICKF